MRVVRWSLLPLVLLLLCASPAAAQQEWGYGEGLDVPYVPTPPEVVKAMLKLAGVKKGDFVIDLGCGDGRMVVTAAAEFGARGIGYDLNPTRIKEANENAENAKVTDRVKFIEKNLFEAEIKDATVVTLYLLPSINDKLKPRLLAELKPGSRVVSHDFRIKDWPADKVEKVNGHEIFLWIIPARNAK